MNEQEKNKESIQNRKLIIMNNIINNYIMTI